MITVNQQMKKISQLIVSCEVQYRRSNKNLNVRNEVSIGTLSSRIPEIQHLPRPMCARLAD
jgi:hypothetical protein